MRLELDQFVEDKVPRQDKDKDSMQGEEQQQEPGGGEGVQATKPKNNFILHSVLIHAVRKREIFVCVFCFILLVKMWLPRGVWLVPVVLLRLLLFF